jgi:hypothetical protein
MSESGENVECVENGKKYYGEEPRKFTTELYE